MIKIDEFRKYLAIDKMALDDEVVQQPSLFFEVSEAASDANAERDAAKEELTLADAKLDIEARSKLDEPKEAQIKAYIQTSPKHQAAFDTWLQAKASADTLTALKESFKQRSHALRELADLYASNYFEETSQKTTATQDRVVYNQRRSKLAAARKTP